MAKKMRLRDLAAMVAHARTMQGEAHLRSIRYDGKRYLVVPLEPDDVEVLLQAAETLIDLRNRMDRTLRSCG